MNMWHKPTEKMDQNVHVALSYHIALLKGKDEDTLMLDDIIPDPPSTPEQLDRMGERVKGDPLYKKKVVCF